jgi:hypothetical protein
VCGGPQAQGAQQGVQPQGISDDSCCRSWPHELAGQRSTQLHHHPELRATASTAMCSGLIGFLLSCGLQGWGCLGPAEHEEWVAQELGLPGAPELIAAHKGLLDDFLKAHQGYK